MTQISLPHNPQAGQSENIGQIMANLQAILAVVNGDLRDDNFAAEGTANIKVGRLGQSGADPDEALVWDSATGRWVPNKLKPSMLQQEGATANQYMVWDDTNSKWVPSTLNLTGGVVVDRKTTQKDVVNTVAETDLFDGELLLTGNTLGIGGFVLLVAGGDYLNNSGAVQTIRLRLKLGATTIWDSGVSSSFAANAARRHWALMALIANTGATNSQMAMGIFHQGQPGTPTTGWGFIATQSDGTGFGGTAAEDTTADKALALTLVHSAANANLSMRLEKAQLMAFKRA